MQAKIDASQEFFNSFYKKNPVATNANRFSSICDRLNGSGTVANCDPALGHNGYTVNMATSACSTTRAAPPRRPPAAVGNQT
jgi:hypothetical protein